MSAPPKSLSIGDELLYVDPAGKVWYAMVADTNAQVPNHPFIRIHDGMRKGDTEVASGGFDPTGRKAHSWHWPKS